MSEFSVRSDNVDVEQVMRQIRSRIREKRGVDYTEDEIRELANVKLEKFLDPKGVRSNLLEEYRRVRTAAPPPNYAFGEDTLFETHRGPIRWIRALLKPILKLFFNPNPLIQALHIQASLNARYAEREPVMYEIVHNLVLELTRTGIELKNLKMRVESMSSRLDFDERRARALEGVVQYRPGAAQPLAPPPAGGDGGRPAQGRPGQPGPNDLDNDGNERRARRRRRRGRRRGPDERGERPEGGGQRFEERGAKPDFRPSSSDPGPRTSDLRPPTSEPGPPGSDVGPRTSDLRPSGSDLRPPASDPESDEGG